MSISAATVKELRERTGAGMMECKKALVESDGDIEAAIEAMRKSGQAKAAKKSGRVAAEGVVMIEIAGDGQARRPGRDQLRDRLRGQGRQFQRLCRGGRQDRPGQRRGGCRRAG